MSEGIPIGVCIARPQTSATTTQYHRLPKALEEIMSNIVEGTPDHPFASSCSLLAKTNAKGQPRCNFPATGSLEAGPASCQGKGAEKKESPT